MSSADTVAGCSSRDKFDALLGELRTLGKAAVAFSGGLDSTFLLRAAAEALSSGPDGNVLAVTVSTPYTPRAEIELAGRAARTMGVRHLVLESPVPEAIRDNPPERCYLCKKILFGLMRQAAGNEGVAHLLDGTNLDDLGDYRPGMRALGELGVRSPLLTSGMTKLDIRELSRALGLSVWDKPAGACLLTRLPHGMFVGEAELARIDRAEDLLRELGFSAVRVRCHGDMARIEVPGGMVAGLVEADRLHGIDARLKALGFRHVAVDLAGYRMGSFNEPA